jgi:hypothetical protein
MAEREELMKNAFLNSSKFHMMRRLKGGLVCVTGDISMECDEKDAIQKASQIAGQGLRPRFVRR